MILQVEDNKVVVSFPDSIVHLELVKDNCSYIVKETTATGEIQFCSFNEEGSEIKYIRILPDSCIDVQDAYKSHEHSDGERKTSSTKKLTLNELQPKLDRLIQRMVGRFHRHFKGSLVRVQFISVDATSDSEDFLVTYKHEDSDILWTRKLSDFTAELTKDQISEYGQSIRFVKYD